MVLKDLNASQIIRGVGRGCAFVFSAQYAALMVCYYQHRPMDDSWFRFLMPFLIAASASIGWAGSEIKLKISADVRNSVHEPDAPEHKTSVH